MSKLVCLFPAWLQTEGRVCGCSVLKASGSAVGAHDVYSYQSLHALDSRVVSRPALYTGRSCPKHAHVCVCCAAVCAVLQRVLCCSLCMHTPAPPQPSHTSSSELHGASGLLHNGRDLKA